MELFFRSNINNFYMGLDGINIIFIILLIFIFRLCLNLILNNIISFLLFIFIFLVFITLNLLLFIIFYEFILIPLTILIINKGSKYKKEGLLRLYFYTLISSIFFIIYIIYQINCNGSILIDYLNISFILIIPFIIKIPIFPFLT